jgi:hypothetical protein
MNLFKRKDPAERRAAEQKKIRKVSKEENDPHGFKAMKRNEERAKLYRHSR